jgi:glutathione peroxidase
MSAYEHTISSLDGSDSDVLSSVSGKATLLVNVASKCGLTPQYTALEELHEKYADRGFSVVGFPCNQFMGQEPGTPEEIVEFCSTTYGVTFPLTEKIDVNGVSQHAVYAELNATADEGGHSGDIRWNFEKYVVAPDGRIVARFAPQVVPDSPEVIAAIESVLPS